MGNGNKATPPRSFNTIRHSQTKERAKRRQTERIVLLSICATVLLILIALVALLIGNVATAIANQQSSNQPNQGENPPQQNDGQIIYQHLTKTEDDIHVGDLILVNPTHEYLFPNIPLVNIKAERDKALINGANPYQLADNKYQLHEDAFAAFHEMMSVYYQLEEDGAVTVTGAYRTKAEQESMTSGLTLPGFSDHHTGYCLALRSNSNGGYLEPTHWIYQNSHKYGYITRYPSDKEEETGIDGYSYCFRYVGVAHASYIARYGLCMEEYISLLQKDYAAGEHLKIDGADGNKYEVYYVPASGAELTTLSVPQNYEYTVSGDNSGGFIVTVNLSAPKA